MGIIGWVAQPRARSNPANMWVIFVGWAAPSQAGFEPPPPRSQYQPTRSIWRALSSLPLFNSRLCSVWLRYKGMCAKVFSSRSPLPSSPSVLRSPLSSLFVAHHRRSLVCITGACSIQCFRADNLGDFALPPPLVFVYISIHAFFGTC